VNLEFSRVLLGLVLSLAAFGGGAGYVMGGAGGTAVGLLLALIALESERRWSWNRFLLTRTVRTAARASIFMSAPAAFLLGAAAGGGDLEGGTSVYAASMCSWASVELGLGPGAAAAASVLGCWVLPAVFRWPGQ